MALECTNTLATLDGTVRVHAPRNGKLPELDSLVQTATDKVTAIGRECDRVNTVLVAIGILQALHQVSSCSIPDAHALVQRTGSHVTTIRRHGHSSDTILNAKGVDKLAIENIPKAHGLVSTARGDESTVASKVQRVDVLLVSTEDMLDGALVDIPNLKPITVSQRSSHMLRVSYKLKTYANLLILGTSRKIFAIRTEANAANVQVAVLVDILILESGHILTGGHVEDLSRAIAARRQVLAVTAEAHTANDAIVIQMMHQLHIEDTLDLGVEHGVPIGTLTLLRRRQIIRIPVCQHVSRTFGCAAERGVRRSRARDLRGCTGIRVGDVGLLGGPRAWGNTATALAFTGAWGCSGRWRRSIAWEI